MRGCVAALTFLALISSANGAVTHVHLRSSALTEVTEAEPSPAHLAGSLMKRWNAGALYLAERAHLVQKGTQDPGDEITFTSFMASCFAYAIMLIPFGLLGSCLFKTFKVDRPEPNPALLKENPDTLKEWNTGLCGCFQDIPGFCWAFWCPCVLWADNMSLTGKWTYWSAFFVYLLLLCVHSALGASFFWWICAIFFAYQRGKIREVFEIPSDSTEMVKDYIFWCCLAPCSLAQESRQIAKGYEYGVVPVEGGEAAKVPPEKA